MNKSGHTLIEILLALTLLVLISLFSLSYINLFPTQTQTTKISIGNIETLGRFSKTYSEIYGYPTRISVVSNKFVSEIKRENIQFVLMPETLNLVREVNTLVDVDTVRNFTNCITFLPDGSVESSNPFVIIDNETNKIPVMFDYFGNSLIPLTNITGMSDEEYPDDIP